MPKSVFTFVLLASSLVMLSAMPLLNNNSFSNVIAQGYDNYYGDSSYSQYPTNDKKYECQTGPFEGFFVSSVEFCKFKFDDKDRKDIRDNITGTQGIPGASGPPGPQGFAGPPGLQGPAGNMGATGPEGERGERGLTGATGMTGPASTVPGPQGERGFNGTNGINGMQGPTGISTINGSNYYLITGTQGQIPTSGSTFAQSTASCLMGDVALSAQYLVIDSTPTSPTVYFFASTGVPPTSWTTGIHGLPNQIIETTVNCFDNPPLRP